MRVDVAINNFTAGELSPRLKGRTDYKNYYNGLQKALNMVSLPQGGSTRRPGTMMAGISKDQTDAPFRVRLWPFQFSSIQNYTLEISNGNFRVYANDGVVLNGSTPVDIAVPYQAADIAALAFTQSADTLFICHPNYPPATLTRSSNIAWAYSATSFRDGPYLSINITPTTLSPSGTTGSITVTASSVVGINVTPQSTGLGFQSTDVGRIFRIQLFSLWAWCLITAVADTLHVTATVQPAVNNGASGAIDGSAWAANTSYVTGSIVKNGGLYYQAITGGLSGTIGPSGVGVNIVDGTAIWSQLGSYQSTPWQVNTIYAEGAIITNGGNYYECTTGGTSAATGSGPTGTTQGITDGSAKWDYLPPFSFPTTTTQWQLGKWCVTNGYPYLPTFWQQRLAFLGTNGQPNAVEGSVSSDFTNFAPSQWDGTVVDSNALSWLISDDQVNAVRWVSAAGSSVAMQLGIGTSGSEQVMQPATNSLALSPTNVQVYRETTIGSASGVPALRIGKSVLFFNRSGRKLMDWMWQWAINGYLPFDRTVDAEHITRPQPVSLPGVVMSCYQQQPFGVVWCVRGDGYLVGFTYLPEQNVFAWHRHELGGQYYGGHPIVESCCSIPSPDGTYDELWLSVLRTVAGVPTRTTEVMTRFFDGMPLEQSFFVDCGLVSALTYPNATLSPAASSGLGVVFNASAGVFSAGTVGNFIRANNGVALVRTYVSPTQVTADYYQAATSFIPQAANAWSCTPQFGSFSGLDYLDGETVQILGDGADMGTGIVAGGAFELPNDQEASFAAAGLPYAYDLITMPFEATRAAIEQQGKIKRIDHLYLRLFETLGCQYGQRRTDPFTDVQDSKLDTLETRSAADVMGQAPSIYSGIKRLTMPGGYDEEGQIEITDDGPYPCTVLAIMAKGDVGEVSQ